MTTLNHETLFVLFAPLRENLELISKLQSAAQPFAPSGFLLCAFA
jgi:hypothetical protein